MDTRQAFQEILKLNTIAFNTCEKGKASDCKKALEEVKKKADQCVQKRFSYFFFDTAMRTNKGEIIPPCPDAKWREEAFENVNLEMTNAMTQCTSGKMDECLVSLNNIANKHCNRQGGC